MWKYNIRIIKFLKDKEFKIIREKFTIILLVFMRDIRYKRIFHNCTAGNCVQSSKHNMFTKYLIVISDSQTTT